MAKGTKNKKVEAVEAQTVLTAVKDLELTKVVSEIGSLQVSVQGTLANLTATITNKLQQVEQLDTAITLKEARLQELFGIEKEAVSLDEMKSQKEEELKKHEKERIERDTRWTEEEAQRAKLWQRTEEEYKYTTNLIRKKLQDEFESHLTKKMKEEQIKEQDLQKHWQERENALKAKENEFNDLKSQVATFDQRLKGEVSKAEVILGNVLKKNHDHEVALLKKDAESERNLANAKISAMSGQMSHLEQQIADLQTQLTAARLDAKDISTQALQSASGRQVAEALSRVVDQQQREPQGKQK